MTREDPARTTNNWLVWFEARASSARLARMRKLYIKKLAGDRMGKRIFCSKQTTEKTEQKDEDKQEMANGSRTKGWWEGGFIALNES